MSCGVTQPLQNDAGTYDLSAYCSTQYWNTRGSNISVLLCSADAKLPVQVPFNPCSGTKGDFSILHTQRQLLPFQEQRWHKNDG